MGQEPEQIRDDIEATRSRMGETVEALGYKADVKSRVAGSIQGAKDKVVQSIAGTKDSAVSGLQDKTPSGDDLRRGAKKATGLAQENPLGLAVGAIAVGFLAGLMVPATRTEDEKLGPVADQVKEKAKETGQEALDHGKQVVQETAQEAQDMAKIAADSAKDKAQGHADEVRRSVKEKAQDVSPS
jgi:gas vesicle protein